LATEEFPWKSPTAVTVYSFSGDPVGASVCTGTCAVTWVPVLTTGTPRVEPPILAKDVGIIHRAGGTEQVSYEGKPLYLYAAERFIFSPGGPPQVRGTVGNGNGLAGPGGGKFSVIYPG
jgi:hypothetical protein